jgi:glycosyltransferase involved in cell wall biosynthesis
MPEATRIAYLSYDGLTDPLGQSQILPYILGLEAPKYEFTIFCFEKQRAYSKEKPLIEKMLVAKRIHWVPLTYHRWPPVLSTLWDIYKLWVTVKAHQESSPFQIVQCRSYVTSLVGLGLKKKSGVKFIFDMRGFWADERVEGGLWNLNNPLYKLIYIFFKRKEKQFLTEADHIVSLTENAKREILSWGLKVAPITVIPTCVDLELFDSAKIKKEDQGLLRKKLGIEPTDFVLLYLGSWGTWYLTDEMMRFHDFLKRQKPSAKFLIVTADEIKSVVPGVIVTKASRQQVPLHISLANAAVCFIKPTFSKKASSATKVGEVLAMNVPIVVNGGWGDVEEMRDRPNLIVVNNLADKEAMDDVLMYRLPIEKCSPFELDERLSLKAGIAQYKSILSGVRELFLRDARNS